MEHMENTNNTSNYDDILSFVAPKETESYIKVIGVGGGGCNAVNHMYRQGIVGVNFVVCNTDAQALQQSPVPVKIQLGRTKGLGAGNVPAVAQQAALEKTAEIKEVISTNTHMLFVTAGMGGGTGTGAAPVVASVAKEIELDDDVKEILVVGIVSTPFSFEGRRRLEQAQAGIKELRKYVDAILVINNDNLRKMGGKMPFKDALAKADDVLSTAAKGISEIITVHTMINVDFRDVNTVMSKSGVALMGVGKADGENRAEEAIMQAMDSPLLNDNSIEGAKSILLCVIGSEKSPLLLEEVYTVTDYVRSHVGEDVELIYGAGSDNCTEDFLQVTLVATGFNEKSYEVAGHTHVATIMTDGTVHSTPSADWTTMRRPDEVENKSSVRKEPQAFAALNTDWGNGSGAKRVVALDEGRSETPLMGATPFLNSMAAEASAPVMAAAPASATAEDKALALDTAQAWFEEIGREETVASAPAPVEELMPQEEPAEVSMQVESPVQADMFEPTESEVPAFTPMASVQAAVPEVFTEVTRIAPSVSPALERAAQPAYSQQSAYATETLVADQYVATSYADHPSYQERMDRMRRFKEQLDANGLDYIEKVPAWKRKDLDLNPPVPSSRSEMSDMMVMPDGRITKNAYLRDNERVD